MRLYLGLSLVTLRYATPFQVTKAGYDSALGEYRGIVTAPEEIGTTTSYVETIQDIDIYIHLPDTSKVARRLAPTQLFERFETT